MNISYANTRRFLAPRASATGKVQRLGIGLLGAIIALAVAAPLLTPYAPDAFSCQAFAKPSAAHLLGCDDAGHDILSQLLYGSRVSLLIGLLVAAMSTAIAAGLAILVGLRGGWIDRMVMRLVDVMLAMPFMPLVIVLGVYFGASIRTQIIVIALIMWASPLRELRAQILSLRHAGFVEASRAMGASAGFIGLRHLLPELAPLIVPQFIRIAHSAILVETSLSFLGLGDPLQVSWGTTLFHANARAAFLTGAWLWWILPAGLAISLTVLSLAFIGFGYDGALTPRIKRVKPSAPVVPEGAGPQAGAAITACGLRIRYDSENGSIEAVKGVDLTLPRGALVGLVGESGSGKTTAALAILQLLAPPARMTAGAVYLEETDLAALPPEALRALRGRKIALIPQSAMNALNPVLTLGDQLEEALQRSGLDAAGRRARALEWLGHVGLQPHHAQSYAHELSGGMRQRAVIAIAMVDHPDVVIADEPTTGLDVLVQEDIMALLLDLRRRFQLSVLFVTHNLPLIARHADRLAVMYQGQIVDEGPASDMARTARHPHTQALFASLLPLDGPKRWSQDGAAAMDAVPVLDLRGVSKDFARKRWWQRAKGAQNRAVDEVSLTLRRGEKLGLVGGSGAGKSTLARLMMGMTCPDHGAVFYQGRDVAGLGRAGRKVMAHAVHLVFQDPYQSIRNGLSIHDIVAEPLRIRGLRDRAEITQRVRAALAAVKLPDDAAFLSRLPVQLSGGQRQRVAFARALVSRPQVIIADEPTSMLDQSVRMEVMDLMEDLRQRYGTAFLFITHDIALARHFCDRLLVLQQGRVVEAGRADQVIAQPQDRYTRALIAAVDPAPKGESGSALAPCLPPRSVTV